MPVRLAASWVACWAATRRRRRDTDPRRAAARSGFHAGQRLPGRSSGGARSRNARRRSIRGVHPRQRRAADRPALEPWRQPQADDPDPFPVPAAPSHIEESLIATGRAEIYGIYFDFAKATIRPESEAVLKEIAGVMTKNPTWVLSVEGHTDNIGGTASNQDLSVRRRAPCERRSSIAITSPLPASARLATANRGRRRPTTPSKDALAIVASSWRSSSDEVSDQEDVPRRDRWRLDSCRGMRTAEPSIAVGHAIRCISGRGSEGTERPSALCLGAGGAVESSGTPRCRCRHVGWPAASRRRVFLHFPRRDVGAAFRAHWEAKP